MPDYVVDDYVASYTGTRFVDSIAYVRRYPEELKALSSLLSAITTPVHFLAAKHDPFLPLDDPRSVAAALPHGRVTELDNSHNAWEEDPETYAAAIAGWVLGGYDRGMTSRATAGRAGDAIGAAPATGGASCCARSERAPADPGCHPGTASATSPGRIETPAAA